MATKKSKKSKKASKKSTAAKKTKKSATHKTMKTDGEVEQLKARIAELETQLAQTHHGKNLTRSAEDTPTESMATVTLAGTQASVRSLADAEEALRRLGEESKLHKQYFETYPGANVLAMELQKVIGDDEWSADVMFEARVYQRILLTGKDPEFVRASMADPDPDDVDETEEPQPDSDAPPPDDDDAPPEDDEVEDDKDGDEAELEA